MATINLDRKEFIKVINIGGAFAAKTRVMPILNCVKVKIANGYITVVSTDNENAISKKMPIQDGDLQITFCVDYKDISSYIKLITDDTITLEVVNDKEIEIKRKNGEITLPLSNINDFPKIKTEEYAVKITVDSAIINNWIVEGRGFLDNTDIRSTMGGIYFYNKDGEFGCCATDSRVLYTDNVNLDINTQFEFVLNRNALKAVCDACMDNDTIDIKIGDKNITFIGNNISVSARVIEGKYPNFKAVLPKDNNIEVKIDRPQLTNAINRLKIGASQEMIKMTVSGMNMEITSNDITKNKKVIENIMVEANGGAVIGFSADNILLAASAITTDNMVFNLKEPNHAAIIREDNEDSNKKILVMPMRLGEE